MSLTPEMTSSLSQLSSHIKEIVDAQIVAINSLRVDAQIVAIDSLSPCFESLIDNRIS
ncbi:hypothetical protein CROQUDRAFT_100625 [Cronartium quercuum f. sp. fusiforme G11]|uniref:Uncharacterized protein n=1 Tax=Cronartium quercuum f. sp. fusiforme G11 TaxID=708437 RepID=A0A9P6T5T7_9BASI|nr:hypothetical protein CROQUDRAFT_100625 [Cronartium quercuum f. sp. fusiforme G11]